MESFRLLNVRGHKMKLAILALLTAFSTPALSCRSPPEAPYTPYQELLRWSKNIVLARVETTDVRRSKEDPRNGVMTYRLRTEKILLGTPPSTFEFHYGWWSEGYELPDNQKTTFRNHTDPKFWVYGGRSPTDSSCRVSPQFEKGALYLVFLDKPYHQSGFEKIESKDDLWLKVVELSIQSGL